MERHIVNSSAHIVTRAIAERSRHSGHQDSESNPDVTMRLARASTPAALIGRLVQLDATRAPLRTLRLQGWIRLFGPTEASAGMLSVLCGLLTVGLVWWIGCLVFDASTGVWAASLAVAEPASGLLLP